MGCVVAGIRPQGIALMDMCRAFQLWPDSPDKDGLGRFFGETKEDLSWDSKVLQQSLSKIDMVWSLDRGKLMRIADYVRSWRQAEYINA